MTTVVRVQVPSLAPPVFSGDCSRYARVVELADSLDSGSSVHYARAGSSPASRTTTQRRLVLRWVPLGETEKYIPIRASGGIGRLARFRF